jgi:hypothetical protein
MKKYDHLRAKAVELRKRGYSLTAIQQMLSLGKTTVYYWVKGVECPIITVRSQTESQKIGTRAMQDKYAKRRAEAYSEWYSNADNILSDINNRDFALLYLTEGYRKCRNHVNICNSNPAIIAFSFKWLQKHTSKKPHISVRLHPDSDVDEVSGYWAKLLGVPVESIHSTRKSNSGRMAHRNWRSKYCVLSITFCDTCLRSKIQALMDRVQENWVTSTGT